MSVNWVIIGSDKGLSLIQLAGANGVSAGSSTRAIVQHEAIILIVPNFFEIRIKRQFLFKKMHLNMLSVECQSFCSGFNGLSTYSDILCWVFLMFNSFLCAEIFWKHINCVFCLCHQYYCWYLGDAAVTRSFFLMVVQIMAWLCQAPLPESLLANAHSAILCRNS